MSKFVGCDEDEVLFFSNPTSAIANVINSLNLNDGDEVLMTDHEYGALVRQWNLWGEKNNVKIKQQKVPVPVTSKDMFIDNFWRGVSKKTKVIFISQITSPTAIIFPVKEIVDLAKNKGILTIIDGAHVPGHIDLNIHSLGCDFLQGLFINGFVGQKEAHFCL